MRHRAHTFLLLLVCACGARARLAQTQGSKAQQAPPPTVATQPVATVAAPAALPLSLEERAANLHREAIVVDTHDDITSAILDEGFDLGRPTGKTATDLPKMRAGGITAEFFAIYVDKQFYEHPSARTGGAARRALDMIDITYQQIERHQDALVLATTVADIRRAKLAGKIAILMGIEGGHAIENSLYALREFYRLGVRYMTLTHTNNNDWADASGAAVPAHHGLTSFGEAVVGEMQRIGMLVDVSHVSDETFEGVMRVARAPVIASHSSARALCDVPRNLSDDELRQLARNDGVAMVNFYPGFLDARYAAAAKAHSNDLPTVSVATVVDHIQHVAKVAGIDHVGLGSDFDGVSALPEGLSGLDGLPRITLELLRRGFSDTDVMKILGENFLRVMSRAEAYASSTGTTLSGSGNVAHIDAPRVPP